MPKGNKNMRNVPNLRFPEFLEKWEVKFIGELSDEFKSGKFIKSEDITKTGQYPVFGGNGLRGFTNEYNHNGEFVLIGRQGALCGNVRFVRGKCYMTEHAIVVSANKHNHTVFLLYLLDKMKLNQYSDQSAQPGLAVNKLLKLRSVVPSLAEQKKIASLLSYIDLRIQTQNKIITQLESLMCGLRKKIFMQQIRFKDDCGNEFPKWKIEKLGKVTQIYDGTHQTPRYEKKGIPFYSVENVTANNFSETKFISEKDFEIERIKIEKGDILLTRIGDIGTARHIDWDVKASFYVSLALIKKSKYYHSKYLSHYISTYKFQRELWNRTIHVAFPKKINLGEIGECVFEIPELSEQIKIAKFLSSLDEKIEIETKILKEYEAQKQYLLKNMFV